MHPLRLLLPALTALVLVSAAKADTIPTAADPCKIASTDSVGSAGWSAHLSRRAAIFMIQHLREFCRLASDDDPRGTPDALQTTRRALLGTLHAQVLAPLYRAHPDLAAAQATGPRQTAFTATRRDISRRTATRLVDELQQLQKQFGDLAPAEHHDETEAQAIARAERLSSTTAELSFAELIAFTAYPDLFKRAFRNVPVQPRTAERDASFRQMAPPRGTVRLSDAAYRRIKSFMRQLRRDWPDVDDVATISWSKDLKRKGPDDSGWIDEGAGWTLGAWHRSEVPPDVIDKVRGLDIVFNADDPSTLKGKTFDIEGNQLVLRN
ncbi:exported hypothetical protein [Bradyrhizobium sp. STM 3843]|uniref:hypothetical protein n=1 Tax=Bradyrhizobium sp. STM 3843 TaxID=551947 RepID=UPI0002406685|nr:hypothetical protein [Bradyrhizobium sp. STM 3843]CCE04625.1 exported hypothetical protein [Bradyrhizobium sp. STM 3843]